jgi:TM2 domain-containing membrane protein YozV
MGPAPPSAKILGWIMKKYHEIYLGREIEAALTLS